MEVKDQRPNLIGKMIRTSGGVDTTHVIQAKQQSQFGRYQTRTVSKTRLPSPLPMKYGYVEPIRAADFDLTVGMDDGQNVDPPQVRNYDGNQNHLRIQVPHVWATGLEVEALVRGIPTATTAAQKNYAQTMALSRVSLSGVEGLIEAAEMPETFSFMRSPLSSLTKLVTGVTHRTRVNYERNVRQSAVRWHTKLQKHRDLTDAFAGTWLAGRYAVTPMIYTVGDIAETAAGKYNELFRVFSAKGTQKFEFNSTGNNLGDWCPSWWPYQMRLSHTRDTYEERKVVYTIRYYPAWWNKDVVQLARWGLSPTQLPAMLYEIIPFSFMLDWVSNLGMWIKAVTPKPELQILDVCMSEKWHYSHHIQPYSIGAGYVSKAYVGQSGILLRDVLKRTIVTNQLIAPQLQWRKGGIKLLQSLDIVALLAGTLARKLTPLVKILKVGEDRLINYGLSLAKPLKRDRLGKIAYTE